MVEDIFVKLQARTTLPRYQRCVQDSTVHVRLQVPLAPMQEPLLSSNTFNSVPNVANLGKTDNSQGS
jgi:hypothetical protein